MNCFRSVGNWDRRFHSHLRHGCLVCVHVFILCLCCPVCRYSKCHVTSNKAKSNLECAEEQFQTRGWVRYTYCFSIGRTSVKKLHPPQAMGGILLGMRDLVRSYVTLAIAALRRAKHSPKESYRLWKMITEQNKRPGPWMGWKSHCEKNWNSSQVPSCYCVVLM
jgi:hypothetical protein